MPEWAKDLVVQIPVVSVFAYVVLKLVQMMFSFLKDSSTAGAAARKEERDDFSKAIEGMQADCHAEAGERQRSLEGHLVENGKLMGETTRMLGRLDTTIRRQNGGPDP